MAVQVSYPGVYVEEIPSGVRTITGVPTSVAAFVGRARRGPTNTPTVINNYADFERIFGALSTGSTLGFAVRDFYINGGAQAVIVRLFRDEDVEAVEKAADDAITAGENAQGNGGNPPTPADASNAIVASANALPAGKPKDAATAVAAAAAAEAGQQNATPESVVKAARGVRDDAVFDNQPVTRARIVMGTAAAKNELTLWAVSEGTWGNRLRARVDHDVSPSLKSSPLLTNAEKQALFNLYLHDHETGETEQFRNVSILPNKTRSVNMVLRNESRLARVLGGLPQNVPPQHDAPAPGRDIWDDGPNPLPANAVGPNTKVEQAGQVADDGNNLNQDAYTGTGKAANKQGLFALDDADIFNLLCLPPFSYEPGDDIPPALIAQAAAYCQRRRALLLVDPPQTWNSKLIARTEIDNLGTRSNYAAVYFPRLRQPNPLRDNQIETFVPCGAVAGVMARTDGERGVWKAPAGLSATLVGVPQLSVPLTDAENGELNPLGINCLRVKPGAGRVVWGARTLEGDDRTPSDWKYIPVRRLALFIEESLYRGTQWVVFEPNDEPLWAQIRLNVGAFMQNLFRQGAFAGRTPRDAYLVKCDAETTTANDQNLGIVNILVGFAPLKPAEFVVIKIQQLVGQIQV